MNSQVYLKYVSQDHVSISQTAHCYINRLLGRPLYLDPHPKKKEGGKEISSREGEKAVENVGTSLLRFIEQKSLQHKVDSFEDTCCPYTIGRVTGLREDWDVILVFSFFFQPKWCLHLNLFEDLFKQLYDLSDRLGTGAKSNELFTLFFALYAERAQSETSINVESLYKEAVELLITHLNDFIEKQNQELSFIESLKKKEIKPTPLLKIFEAVPINNESKELLDKLNDLLFLYVLKNQFSTNPDALAEALNERDKKAENGKTCKTTVRKIEKTVVSLLNQLTPIYPKIPPYLLEKVLKSIIYYCHTWMSHKEALKNLFFEFVESFKTLPTNKVILEALLLSFLALHTEGVNEKTFTPVENAAEITLLIAEKPFQNGKQFCDDDINYLKKKVLTKLK